MLLGRDQNQDFFFFEIVNELTLLFVLGLDWHCLVVKSDLLC